MPVFLAGALAEPTVAVSQAASRPSRRMTVSPTWQTTPMSDVDIAKLKRLRAAVSSALDRVPEKSAHGLPPTYNSLRGQIIEAVPQGLRTELEAIAPQVDATGQGPQAIIEAAQNGAIAYAHLAALKGWLDAVISPG
jgi:hypothetical protein